MADVGARIEVTGTGTPRSGVVTAVNGAMLTVLWDTGDESSFIPGAGDLRVVTDRRRRAGSPPARKTTAKKARARTTAAKKTTTRKASAKRAPARKTAAKRSRR